MATEPTTSWAIYARQSLDRTGAGLAVERQIQDCRKLGKRMKLGGEPVIYIDNDRSATSGRKRPDYERLLRALRTGQHHAVVAWHTDRLHRRPIELEEYISVSESHGVLTHTVQRGPLDLSTADGQLQARIAGAVARHEVQHKAARRSRAAQQKAEKGGLNGGGRSFGYGRTIIEVTRWDEDQDGRELPRTRKTIEEPQRLLLPEEREESITNPDGTVTRITRRRKSVDIDQLNEQEAAAIRAAFDAILQRKATTTSIWTEWNRRGLLTPFGNAWTGSTFRRMLLRPSLAGLVTYNKTEYKDGKRVQAEPEFIDVEASWEPIVDPAKWRAVETILSDPARRTSPGPTPKHLCGGITFCGAVLPGGKPCGRKMKSAINTIKSKRAGERHNFPVYRCSHGGPGHSSIKMDLLNASVIDAVLTELQRTRYQPVSDDPVDEERLAEIEAELKKVRDREERLADAISDGLVSREAARKTSVKIKADRERLHAERERLTRTPLGDDGAGEAMAAFWEGLDLAGPKLDEVSNDDDLGDVLDAVGRSLIAAMERRGMDPEEARARLAMEERFDTLPLDQQRALISSTVRVTVHRGQGAGRIAIAPLKRAGR